MILVMALTILLYKGYKNTRQVIVNHVFLEESGAGGKPFRVVHISDMHLENISITPEQLYSKLCHEQIDLIALTGDFLDRKRSIPRLQPYLNVLNKLQATHGIYAVFGNHDYFLKHSDFLQLKKTLEENGIKTMINENDVLWDNGRKINIIGIDDAYTDRSDLRRSYAGLTDGYHLVLTHDPTIVLRMKDMPSDYLLSGHFHGGQIHWPKPYHIRRMGKLARLNMIKGLHHHNGKYFYINEGLGQTGVNIRFGSRPEITVHHLSLP